MSKKHSEIHKNSLWDAVCTERQVGGWSRKQCSSVSAAGCYELKKKKERKEEEILAFKMSLVASLCHSSKL